MPKRRKKRNKKKRTTLQQVLDYLNDPVRMIKEVSRDIGMRRHKDKKKYTRRRKHKKGWNHED